MGLVTWLVRAVPAATAVALALSLTGCVRNPGDTRGDLSKYSSPVKVKSTERTELEQIRAASVVPTVRIHHSDYVSVRDVARAIGIHAQWLKDGVYAMGAEDPQWTFRTGDSTVKRGRRTERMPAPAVKDGDRLYIPASSLPALFGREASFRIEGGQVSFYPMAPRARSAGTVQPFADGGTLLPMGSAAAGSSGKYASLLQDAQKYLGVRYDFGAGDYAESGTFDCSSFVQYLFARYGVDLPRTARDQAELGTPVSRDSLRPGDLLFFSVPGRFKSDATVGHVGIYMGNGKMIHSSPQPQDGVQISDINTGYWQDNFLLAKRIPLP